MYSDEELNNKATNEFGIDTDWYFIDTTGKIAIVASAGGMLPNSVSRDMDKLKRMNFFFRSLPIISTEIIIEDVVIKKIEKYNDQQKEAYLKDLYFMVSRGFYYFDKMILNDYFDFRYYLKAVPKIPLLINNIHEKLKDVLPEAFVEQDIKNIKSFLVNEIL